MTNGLINVAIFLISTIFSLYAFIVLLRFFLQWVKADFYNPVSQMIMKATNAVVLPLRRVVPGFFHLDWSCVVVVYLLFLIEDLLIGLLKGYGLDPLFIFVKPLLDMPFAIINLFVYLIVIRAIASWFIQGGYNPIFVAIYQITEPLLSRARKIIKPTAAGFDFSPIIVLVVLFCIQIFLQSVIAEIF